MEKYMEIKKDCPLYTDYFEAVNNREKVIALFKEIKAKYGIETDRFYLLSHCFRIDPTDNDCEKFGSLMKKTCHGEFKRNSEISKEWVRKAKDIGAIRKPYLFGYFNLLGHHWRERLFHIGDKLYCSIQSDGEVSIPEFAVEMKASEFYKIVEDSDGNETKPM